MFALGAAVAGDPKPGEGDDHEDHRGRQQQRHGDHDQGHQGDDEGERATAAAFAATGAGDQVADHEAGEHGAGQAQDRAEGAVEEEPGDQPDHRRKQGHAATGGAVGAGRAGEHPDRDADA